MALVANAIICGARAPLPLPLPLPPPPDSLTAHHTIARNGCQGPMTPATALGDGGAAPPQQLPLLALQQRRPSAAAEAAAAALTEARTLAAVAATAATAAAALTEARELAAAAAAAGDAQDGVYCAAGIAAARAHMRFAPSPAFSVYLRCCLVPEARARPRARALLAPPLLAQHRLGAGGGA